MYLPTGMAVDDSAADGPILDSSSPIPQGSLVEKAPSRLLIHAWCKNGNLANMQAFLDTTLPALPHDYQRDYCSHPDKQCNDLPCTISILNYAHAATEGRQVKTFEHLWDTYLAPRGIQSIPWPCLKAAAFHGDVTLAQTFHTRDPLYFQSTESSASAGPSPSPGAGLGAAGRNNQFKIAIRNNRFDYIDIMLAHGADINRDAGSDLVKMVVHCAVDDDAVTVERIRFLAARGMDLTRSAALRDMVSAGSLELVECLLDNGADVNRSSESMPMPSDDEKSSLPPLMLAVGSGNEEMVELLLARGGNAEYFDQHGRTATDLAVEGGHEGVVQILKIHMEKKGKKL